MQEKKWKFTQYSFLQSMDREPGGQLKWSQNLDMTEQLNNIHNLLRMTCMIQSIIPVLCQIHTATRIGTTTMPLC